MTQLQAAPRRSGQWFIALGVCCLVAAAVLFVREWWRPQPESDLLQTAWSELATHIEAARDERDVSAVESMEAHAMEPMPTWESPLSGRTYVGMLEVQSTSLSLPLVVAGDGVGEDEGLPQWVSGSCYAKNLVVQLPEALDAAGALRAIELGAEVQLTTIDGVTFLYGVSARGSTPAGSADLAILLVDEDGTTYALSCQLVW